MPGASNHKRFTTITLSFPCGHTAEVMHKGGPSQSEAARKRWLDLGLCPRCLNERRSAEAVAADAIRGLTTDRFQRLVPIGG